MNDQDAKEERLTLELLDAIEQRSDISQRHLARQMGVALGLANSYLKRCAKKGLVKVREAPANRYLYYLTPKGFAEKARLTARFLSTSLHFYRESVEACAQLYRGCENNGWSTVLLCGVSDLAEIAIMRSVDTDVEVPGVFDPQSMLRKLFTKPVFSQWDSCPEVDAYVVTDLADPLRAYRNLAERVADGSRILVPDVLGIDTANIRLKRANSKTAASR